MIVIRQILVNNYYYLKEIDVSKFKRIFSLRWQETHREYLGSEVAQFLTWLVSWCFLTCDLWPVLQPRCFHSKSRQPSKLNFFFSGQLAANSLGLVAKGFF